MSKPIYTVVRDSREHDGKGYTFYRRRKCAGMEVCKLEIGDYSIKGLENTIAIERKGSVTELVKCMFVDYEQWNKRLSALSSLKHSFLILDFPQDDIARIPFSILTSLQLKRPYCSVTTEDVMSKLKEMNSKGIGVIFAVRTNMGDKYNRQHGQAHAWKIFDMLCPLLTGTPIPLSSLRQIPVYQFS